MREIKIFLTALFLILPAVVIAGTYTTGISPSGTSISSPITATFNIQDFAQRDSGSLCTSSFVPAEMQFNYWFGQGTDFNTILPAVIPTSAMISSGIYTATFNLSVGQAVDSIGVQFFQFEDGGGIRCDFYGNQPNGVSTEPWLAPAFTVVSPPPVSVGSGPAFKNRVPFVNFDNFPKESVWSGKKTIAYTASDPDNPPYGLKDLPINFYISGDGGSAWKELDVNQSNKGEYVLDTNNFSDGRSYALRITVFDNANEKGEVVSNVFSIDNSPPVFEISIPAASDVIFEKDKISLQITSSENLKQTPQVKIIQAGAEPQPLLVGGFGKNFSASYTVLKSHVGTAVVSVQGEDLAGNSGAQISSGKTFLVSRLGPPPPTFKNLVNNESLGESKINVLGNAPSAKEVVFILNGQKEITAKPDNLGNFIFKDVELSGANNGFNTLSVSGVDEKGLRSDERVIKIKLNSPPEISWVSAPLGTVSGLKNLEWKASDPNDDQLVYSLYYSVDGGKNWDFFARGILENKYELNSREFFDGDNIRIKVAVSDGTAQKEIISERLAFQNNSSFSVNIPKNYLLDKTTPSFSGEARISQGKIAFLRYSLEKEQWSGAQAPDGKFDSSFERYSIKFTDPLFDGKHILFIEAGDENGNVFRTFAPFIIDTAPPVPPKITFPLPDEVIDNSADIDSTLGGIQINVLGTTEAGADAEFIVNNRRYAVVAGGRGEFSFTNVTFLNRGVNRYFLSSTDSVGNISKIEGFIISDNPPKLSVITPQSGEFIGGTKEIKWQAFDEDDDQLTFQVLYRRKNGVWISLAQNFTEEIFKLDVSKFLAGEYELKIIVNDGLVDVSATVEKLFVDNNPPKISLDSGSPFLAGKSRLVFSGSVTDDLSGVKFVEYSINGQEWFKAVVAEGYLSKNASFVGRHPFELEDGEYNFGARAIDVAGNVSEAKFKKIVIDLTAPRIGSFVVSSGSIALLPEIIAENRIFKISAGAKTFFKISLEADTDRAELAMIGSEVRNLSKNKSTGLWETDIVFDNIGTTTMLVSARDFSGNRVVAKKIASVEVLKKGKTQPGARITIFARNPEDQRLLRWPSEAYGGENPIESDGNGEYDVLLPEGIYQILVQKPGFERLRTSDFNLISPRFIDFDFELRPRSGVRGFFEDLLEKFNF